MSMSRGIDTTPEATMNTRCKEPTLNDTLSDPVVQAMMAADGIEFQEFEAFLQEMARKMRHHKSPAAPKGWDEVLV